MPTYKNYLKFDEIWRSIWIEFSDCSCGPRASTKSEIQQILNYYYAVGKISYNEYLGFKCFVREYCPWLPYGVSDRVVAHCARWLSNPWVRN